MNVAIKSETRWQNGEKGNQSGTINFVATKVRKYFNHYNEEKSNSLCNISNIFIY